MGIPETLKMSVYNHLSIPTSLFFVSHETSLNHEGKPCAQKGFAYVCTPLESKDPLRSGRVSRGLITMRIDNPFCDVLTHNSDLNHGKSGEKREQASFTHTRSLDREISRWQIYRNRTYCVLNSFSWWLLNF